MSRLIRNTVILAKIETAYNADPAPTGSANAMLVSNLSVNPLNANNVDRDLVRPYFGASEQLVGTSSVEMGFDVELTGREDGDLTPAWNPLLRACAFAMVAIASTRVDFTPITGGQESLTIYWYDDGALHVATGCRGTCTLSLKSGERPLLAFKFTGLGGVVSAASLPTPNYANFKTPEIPTDLNTADLVIGGAVASTGAPAITGGTAYPSTGIELDIGATVAHTPLIGGESVDVTDRAVTGKVMLDLTAAAEVAFMDKVRKATLTSFSLLHGLTVGRRVLLHLPTVQLINPTKAELNGRRMISYDLRCAPTPGGAGNDEMRLVTSF